jgi:hypothetical protein
MNALIKLNKFYSPHIAKRWRKSIMKEVDKINSMAVGAYFLLENVWRCQINLIGLNSIKIIELSYIKIQAIKIYKYPKLSLPTKL